MKHLFKIILCLTISGIFNLLSASHNRSGEILYKRVAPFTQQGGTPVYNYSITVIKYFDAGPLVADRCVDTVYFGDGTKAIANRVNGPTATCNCGGPCGEIIVNDPNYMVKQSTYTVMHTYAGAGSYVLHSSDPNRTAGIHNIPNSDQVPFYLTSLIVISATSGINSSPVLTNPPIYRAAFNTCYYYDLLPVDADGDSLAFELVSCLGANGQAIPGFFQPEAGVNGTFNINWNGLLTWCVPQYIDAYSTAIEVREYRKNTSGEYQLIGKILRDMQIIVTPTQQGPVSPLGIRENNLSDATEIYPNPFTEKLSIDFNGNTDSSVEISLYLNDGKLVFKQLIKESNGQQEISTSTLNPGLYLLEIKTNSGAVHKKLIKN